MNVRHSGTYILPNLLTAFNLICGIIAILMAIENYSGGITDLKAYTIPAWLLLAAMVFDFLDGKVARWTNTVSSFGVKIDSLSDLVSFGIAPAVLAYTALLHEVALVIKVVVCFLFLLAGAWRLARFNSETTGEASAFFVGLPIPGAAAFFATLLLVTPSGPERLMPKFLGQSFSAFSPQMSGYFAAGILVILAVLMVSRIPFPAFKRMNRRNLVLLCGVAMFFVVLRLILPWENIVFLIVSLYFFIGLFQYFLNQVLKLHQKNIIHLLKNKK